LDPDALAPWAEARHKHGGPADLADDPDLRAEIQSAVDDANRSVSQAESIRRFTVVPGDWTEEAGQLTPSLKLRRSVVMSELRREVDALYE
jgi:long-chain acyl-CoA synthetase